MQGGAISYATPVDDQDGSSAEVYAQPVEEEQQHTQQHGRTHGTGEDEEMYEMPDESAATALPTGSDGIIYARPYCQDFV